MSARRRPVGSSAARPDLPSGNASGANSPTTISGNLKGSGNGGRRHYVTRGRVEAAMAQLSPRDLRMVEDVASVQVLTGQQVRRLHFEDSAEGRRLARRDLARLAEWRVLTRLDRRIGGVRAGSEGYAYVLDVLGQRLIWPDRRHYRVPWTPGAGVVAHAVAVSELYVQLREQARASVTSLLYEGEPQCWRGFHGPGGRRLILKPDARVTWTVNDYEDNYFIEIDLATESGPRLAEKARLYVRYWQSGREQEAAGVFPQVLWITPTDARRRQIMDVLTQLDAEHAQLFAVTTADQAADLIASGGALA